MNTMTRDIMGWLLNIDWSTIPPDAKLERQFADLPEGWAATGLVLAAIAVLVLLVALYRREGRELSIGRKLLLFGLRAGVLALALAICFRPILYARRTVIKPAHFLILVDVSASMTRIDRNLPDERAAAFGKALGIKPEEVRKLRRHELAARLLERQGSRLAHRLSAGAIVEIYTFSEATEQVRSIPQLDADSEPTDDPARPRKPDPWRLPRPALKEFGRATHLGEAVREVLGRFEGEPVAGILVLSDGKSNAGPDVAEAMRLANQRKVPIWAVGIGDPNPPRNLDLRTISAPPAVFQGTDPFEIKAELFHQGFANESAHVVLEKLEGDQATEIEAKDVTLGPESKPAVVTFRQVPGKLGTFRYRVRVDPLPKEENKQDNARSTAVQVKDSWFKVLLVAGGPTFEYRVLRNYLGREKELELSQWLQSAPAPWNVQQNQWYWGAARVRKARKLQRIGETAKAARLMSEVIAAKVESWEATAREELKQWGASPVEVTLGEDTWERRLDLTSAELHKRYDVVILLDADPAEIERDAVDNLRKFVEDKGGGLLFVAGEKFAYPFLSSPERSGLLQLLPVIPALETAGDRYEVGRLYPGDFRPVLTPEGQTHALTRIDATDAEKNRELWGSLPGMYWAFPVKKHKAHARVLLRHSNPDESGTDGKELVLAAVHNYGPGKVLWIGFDETYRWRANAELVYQQFWTQTVRHLTTGKLLGGKRRARFILSHSEFDVGEKIRIQVEALASDYASPLLDDELLIEVTGPQESNLTLKAVPGSPGWFEGAFHAPSPGEYHLHVAGFQKRAYRPAQLQIIPARLEFREPLLDEAKLKGLVASDRTPTDDDAPLVPGVGRLLAPAQLEMLPGLVPDASIELEELTPPNELWASPLAIMLVTLLLTAEWLIRKLSNLL